MTLFPRSWLCLAILLLDYGAAEQQPQFQTFIEGVRIDVLVSDGGRPISGLTAEDFEVLDNGVPQRVALASAAASLSIALMLDTSSSVADSGHLSDLVRAGQLLLSTLSPDDTVAFLTFSRGVRMVVPSTRDARSVNSALLAARSRTVRRLADRTAMWDAVFAGASLVTGGSGRSLVCVLTDGADNASWVLPTQPRDARWTIDQKARTIDVLRGSGIVVDVVWIRRKPGSLSVQLDDGINGTLSPYDAADSAGGMAFSARDAKLPQRLADRLTALRAGYVLTYTPAGVPRGDGWHKLIVRLKNKRGKIQARTGYFSGPVASKPDARGTQQ